MYTDHPGQEWLEGALNSTFTEQGYLELQEKRRALAKSLGVEHILEKHNLDAVVVPGFTELAGANAMSGTVFFPFPGTITNADLWFPPRHTIWCGPYWTVSIRSTLYAWLRCPAIR